jgi:truncated hemoglobin YjbI
MAQPNGAIFSNEFSNGVSPNKPPGSNEEDLSMLKNPRHQTRNEDSKAQIPESMVQRAGSNIGFMRAVSAINGTVFERLGGEEEVKKLVENIFKKVEYDPLIGGMFKCPGIDLQRIKEKFLGFFMHISGGADAWNGRPLNVVHAHMRIKDEQFDAFVSHCI